MDQATSYGRYFKQLAQQVVGPQASGEAIQVMMKLYGDLADHVFSRGCKALVVPTLRTTYVPNSNGPLEGDPPAQINGQPVKGLSWALTMPFNLLGRCPVVNVPTGRASNNVPTGMQIVADVYEDVDAFQIAAAYAGVMEFLFRGDAIPDFRKDDQ